jgi:hypothetical protein
MLQAAGAVEIRRNKHVIYELANGKRLVVAATPSDRRSTLNTISNLKRLCAQ